MPFSERELASFIESSENLAEFCQKRGFTPRTDYDTAENLEDAVKWLQEYVEKLEWEKFEAAD